MSAHDQMRAMLDQLMGTGRDGENNKFKVHFTDPRVCKSFLLACCPHDILAATRMDLGECPKLHDLALRADFENASKKKDYYYDVDALDHLQSFINECDRRTEQSKRRLAETQEELSAEVAAKLNKVHELAEQIGKKLAEAEKLGEEGNVEESIKTMGEVDEFRRQKMTAEQEYRNSMPASSYQQQKLRVCDVCSAYLGIHDNDRRLADHFGGKLHLGFIEIRQKLAELTEQVTVDRRTERVDKDRDVGRDRGNDRGRYAERPTSRRPRSRSGSRHRHRSRSNDRRSKDSRDYKHRRRSGSRERRRGSRDERSDRRRRDRSSERSKSSKRSRSRERKHSPPAVKVKEEIKHSPPAVKVKEEIKHSPPAVKVKVEIKQEQEE